MATRQDFQVAQDLIRFVNIMNDLIDVTAYTLQEIDAQKGGDLLIDGETPTFEQLKAIGISDCQNVNTYYLMIKSFLDKVDMSVIVDALTVLGINTTTFKTEALAIKTVRDYVAANLLSTTTKADLIVIGQYIDTNIPKLTLVRRSWCLGS